MTIASNPPIDIPLERMTGAQKWELFRTLLEELDTPIEGQDEIPSWHLEVLAEREAAYNAGKVKVMELDDFLKEARKRMP
jgi:hypothetical protein